jgi:two-component system sensor histidine kinase AlgZ
MAHGPNADVRRKQLIASVPRILITYLALSVLIVVAFSGVTWQTSAARFSEEIGIALLFSACIAPLCWIVLPRAGRVIPRTLPEPIAWGIMLLVMVMIAAVGSLVGIAILATVGYVPWNQVIGTWLGSSLRISIVVTLAVGTYFTMRETMRARVARATSEARLASLEARVQPHFLFNTLNSIAALIPQDPKGAERMTEQLASLLRSSLDQLSPLVPLSEELRTVRDYLEIERVRFGDRLRYEISVDRTLDSVGVPRLAVQTLVENSVKHAISPRREGGSVAVRATRDGRDGAPGVVRVSVSDDGPGFQAATLPEGHGLALLRARLAVMFGAPASLDISGQPGASVVTMTLPEHHEQRSPLC